MNTILSVKKGKIADKTAVIYNYSGHPIPEDGYRQLSERGHTKFIVFNRSIHVDVDADITEQIEKELEDLFTKPNITNQLPQTIVGDRYYICSGHAATNLLLFTALTSLFGSPPTLLIVAIDERKWNEYEMKSIIPVKPWTGKWRSQMRRKYTIEETEVKEGLGCKEPTVILEYDIGTRHVVTRRRGSAGVPLNPKEVTK